MILAHAPTENDVLNRITVRWLREDERPEFDRLLKEKHYLHDGVLTGQSLRYVAELDGQWVALLAFSAASFHLKARDRTPVDTLKSWCPPQTFSAASTLLRR